MKDKELEKKWWEFIRKNELEDIFEYLPNKKNLKILEIGGRDGYQASILSKKGYDVLSIDILPIYPQFFPVKKGNIENLEFDDDSFDIIYSSNMLQEIKNLEKALDEMHRILKNDGIMIHIVPSSWWSIFTNFWHYVHIPWFIFKSRKFNNIITNKKILESLNDEKIKEKKFVKLKKLFLHPLGNNKSFLHEIFLFRNKSWQRLFLKSGFTIEKKKNCRYSYSAYRMLMFKIINIRLICSKKFPSCYCFLCKNNINQNLSF